MPPAGALGLRDDQAGDASALSWAWRLRSAVSAETSSSSSGSVRLPLWDFGSSMRTRYSTRTRAWLTVRVLARRSMSDQRRPRTSPRRSPYSDSRHGAATASSSSATPPPSAT